MADKQSIILSAAGWRRTHLGVTIYGLFGKHNAALTPSDWFRFSLVSFVYDQRIYPCRYPQITHYIFTLHIALPIFYLPCEVSISTSTLERSLPQRAFLNSDTCTLYCNLNVDHRYPRSMLTARGCALGRSTLGPMFHDLASCAKFTLRIHTRVSVLPASRPHQPSHRITSFPQPTTARFHHTSIQSTWRDRHVRHRVANTADHPFNAIV
jgi:hypothetical protein